jgi:PAS domain S-box-containing protein
MIDGIRVLYVDDEPDLLEIAKIILEKGGAFSVDTLSSAPEALEQVDAERYDAIISDYQMPEMDGIIFLRQLRALGNATPFIIFTGKGREEIAIQALNEGADFYIQKGGDIRSQFTELAHKIRQAVARRRAEERMSEVNKAFLAFRPDPLFNITILTGLTGKMLQGTCALYNRLENGRLCSLGMWNTPPDFNPCDQPEGQICNDVILKGGSSPTIIINLPESPYAETDPNVRRYQLQTYVGIPVKIGDRYLGSLCVVYQDHYSPSPQDIEILFFLAQAIAIEDQRRVAGQKLQESEEKYRKLVESSSDMIWEVDTNGLYTYVSPNIRAILGYQPEEVIGRTPFDFIAPAEVESIGNVFNACVASSQPIVRLENTNIHKDGHPVVLETSGEPVLDSTGNLLGFRGIDRDITERKRTEALLRESSRKYAELFELGSEAIFLIDNETGAILEANAAAGEMYGYPRELLLTMNNTDLSAEEEETKQVTTETSPGIKRVPLRYHRRNNGTVFPVEIIGRFFILNGRHVHVAAIRDITDRKRSEKELRESEQKFRSLVEYALEGILIVDFQGTILLANKAAIRTIEADGNKEPITGRNVMEFIAPESRQDVMRDFVQVAQGNDAFLSHYHVISAQGKKIYVESIGKVITYEGKPADLISIRDVTDKKNAEDALIASEKKYRHLIENSHDIIYTLTTEGVFTFVSPSWTTLLGHAVNQVTGKSVRDFVHPDDIPRCNAFLKSTIEKGTRQPDIEYRISHADGSWRWHISKTVPLYDEAGTVIGLEGISSDVTGRKLAEERLSEMNNAFLAFRPDPLFNITILTGLAGKMLQGTCALYNRLENGRLCSLGMWNTPPDFALCDQPEGDICNDVIRNGSRSPTIIQNLLESSYAETDPNIRRHHLQTYVGIPVKIGDRYQGSLCVVYQDHYSPSPQDLEILSFLAQAIAIEDQRRVAGQKLQESEERFRTILNSMQSGVVVIDAHTHQILDANTKALEIIGTPRESVLGSVCHQFICPAELGKCPVTDLGQKVESSERVILTAGGAKKPIYKSVIRTVLGGKDVLIESFVDITERKHAEELLRESEEKYRTLFDSAGDIIFIHNEEGKILAFNTLASERLGYTTTELMSLTVKDVDSEADAPKAPERIARVMEHAHLSFETMHRRKNGSLIPTEVSARYITWEGKPAVLSICRDITERRRAEESLRQANKKLNLLSGITRHDIKNQLVALHGYLELLQNKSSDPALEKYITRVMEAGNRIAEMIEFTREYDMIGVSSPVWQDCRTLVDLAAKEAPLGQVLVKNDIPAGTIVYVDPLIAKVFYNLMDNAVRYGGKITTIQFSVQESGDHRVILCKDDGEGVPADEKERIFDRGFGKNTGLGLALSREILDITGITIRETGEPGIGAQFEMTVPEGMWRVTGKGVS